MPAPWKDPVWSWVNGRLTDVRICTVQFLASSKASSPAFSASSPGIVAARAGAPSRRDRDRDRGRSDRIGRSGGGAEGLILRRAGGRDCSVRHDLGRGEERKAYHCTFWSP